MASQEKTKLEFTSQLLLISVLITGSLIYLKGVLLPFVISLFILFAVGPLITWIQNRLGWPRSAALISTFFLSFLIGAIILLLLAVSFKEFLRGIPLYQQKIISLSFQILEKLNEYGMQVEMNELIDEVKRLPVLNWIRNITGGVFSFAGNFALVGIFTMFLLIGMPTKTDSEFLIEITKKINRYVVTKSLISMATGTLVGFTLGFLGVDLAFMFGLLTFLLNFIPNIGSLIAMALPIPVALVQFGFSFEAALILLLPAIIQFLIGNILEPKMMGEGLDLHPVTILLALMFWGAVWQVPGMFLSVPIVAVLKILLEQSPSTRFLSELMAGRLKSS